MGPRLPVEQAISMPLLRPCVLLTFLCIALGCIPVPTIAGRPASVLSQGVIREGVAVGAFYAEETIATGLADAGGWPYGFLMLDYGFGGGWDARIAAVPADGTGVQGHGSVRLQVLGEPEDVYGRSAAAWSMELGFGAGAEWTGWDAYAGTNLSVPIKDALAYVSYRYHLGESEHESSGYGFSHHMLYLGVDLSQRQAANLAVEIYAGWPAHGGPGPGEAAFRNVGFNVVWRSSYAWSRRDE